MEMRKYNFVIYGFASVIFILDQILKYWLLNFHTFGALVEKKYFTMAFWPVVNDNFSFSIPLPNWLATAIAIIAVIMIIILLSKKILPFFKTSWALILCGALSNILDRIFYGGVIDYIHLSFWPASYNLADLEIITGIILVVINMFNYESKNINSRQT